MDGVWRSSPGYESPRESCKSRRPTECQPQIPIEHPLHRSINVAREASRNVPRSTRRIPPIIMASDSRIRTINDPDSSRSPGLLDENATFLRAVEEIPAGSNVPTHNDRGRRTPPSGNDRGQSLRQAARRVLDRAEANGRDEDKNRLLGFCKGSESKRDCITSATSKISGVASLRILACLLGVSGKSPPFHLRLAEP